MHETVDQVPTDRVRTRRHLAGCSYLPVDQQWRTATPEEMRTLPACEDCARRADR